MKKIKLGDRIEIEFSSIGNGDAGFPKLGEDKNQGYQRICIAGDIGMGKGEYGDDYNLIEMSNVKEIINLFEEMHNYLKNKDIQYKECLHHDMTFATYISIPFTKGRDYIGERNRLIKDLNKIKEEYFRNKE